jgi:Protein of unknown function (DUF2889)
MNALLAFTRKASSEGLGYSVKSSGEPYHRRITLQPSVLSDGKGRIDAQMQDHVHHMKVVINHEGGRVISAVPQGIRLPWDMCPFGIAGVTRTAGMTIAQAREGLGWPGGRTANCVHMVDLARVALAHVDDTEPSVYAITVTPALAPVREARIERDGNLVLQWTLNEQTLSGAEPFDGRTLAAADFVSWRAKLDPALREPATILRRACHIAPSRDINLDRMRVAADSINADGSCYTLQPDVIEHAHRQQGTFRLALTDDDRLEP